MGTTLISPHHLVRSEVVSVSYARRWGTFYKHRRTTVHTEDFNRRILAEHVDERREILNHLMAKEDLGVDILSPNHSLHKEEAQRELTTATDALAAFDRDRRELRKLRDIAGTVREMMRRDL
jgi:hypothetical protein